MSSAPGLDSFLSALRHRGVFVGPTEVSRLQHVFEQSPHLDDSQFEGLLRCTLIKTKEHREAFDPLYKEWLRLAEEAGSVRSSMDAPASRRGDLGAEDIARTKLARPGAKRRIWSYILSPISFGIGTGLVSLVVLLVLIVPAWQISSVLSRLTGTGEVAAPPADLTQTPPTAPLPGPSSPADSQEAAGRAPQTAFRTAMPRIVSVKGPGPWADLAGLILPILLGYIPWIVGAALWRSHWLKYRLPIELSSPARSGPEWSPLFPRLRQQQNLLESDQQRRLIWGIDRFISEEITDVIDLPATVRDTAQAGGLLEVRYRPASYDREVWLWWDLRASGGSAAALVAEVEHSLRRAGLPVRSGFFQDIPIAVQWREGEEFHPGALDGQRQSAVVCVCTDGEGLRRAMRNNQQRLDLHQLLRVLGGWPRLAFIDFSDGKNGMQGSLRAFGIPVLTPDHLAGFLEAQEAPAERVPPISQKIRSDLKLWAAALALSPEPVPEPVAQQLRKHLDLEVSPLGIRHIEEIPGALLRAGRLDWTPSLRSRLLKWLVAVDGLGWTEIVEADDASLVKSVDFWLDHCQAQSRRHSKREETEGELHRWKATLAEQRHQVREALLQLWLQPEKATERLYQLFQGDCRDIIRANLGGLAASDCRSLFREREKADGSVIFLPWPWRGLPPRVKRMLWRMEFAGGRLPEPPEHISRSIATTAILCFICFVVGIHSIILALSLLAHGPPPILKLKATSGQRQEFVVEAVPNGLRSYTILAGRPGRLIRLGNVPAGSEVELESGIDRPREQE